MKLGGLPANSLASGGFMLPVAQVTKPRSPRLLPEQKGCLTEVSAEALYQSRPQWGWPPWAQVSSHGPSFQGDPGSSLEWEGAVRSKMNQPFLGQ